MPATTPSPPACTAPSPLHAEDVARWLVAYLAALLARPAEEILPTASFAGLGVDSVDAVAVTGDLGDWLGWPVDATAAYDYETIAALAQHIAEQAARRSNQPGTAGIRQR
jgi:acyl carrier protein